MIKFEQNYKLYIILWQYLVIKFFLYYFNLFTHSTNSLRSS